MLKSADYVAEKILIMNLLCKLCQSSLLLINNFLLGFECQVPSHQPTPCRRGTFNPGGFQSCLFCPIGFFANYTHAVECEQCPAGFSCPVATNRPIACTSGKYR